MKRSTFRKMEDVLRDYPCLDRKIESIEEEIRVPYREPDDNIGGSKGNKKTEPQLATLIMLEDDERLKSFKKQRQAVDECIEEFGKDTETIIRELYFAKRPRYTIEGLIASHLINVSHTVAYALRKKFMAKLAHKLGLYDL